MADYLLYGFRYRTGNAPAIVSAVEIKDRGNTAANRDAAELLAKAWCLGKVTREGSEYRFVDVYPFVAASERPEAVVVLVAPVEPVKVAPMAPKPIKPVPATVWNKRRLRALKREFINWYGKPPEKAQWEPVEGGFEVTHSQSRALKKQWKRFQAQGR